MRIVWLLLQTTREPNLIYVFELLIQSLGMGQLRLRKSFCLLTSESDCLRKNFNNATQMSLFDVISKLIRSFNQKNINKSKKTHFLD